MFHTLSSRGAAKARMARRLKRFRTGLYGDILSGEEREANTASRACSQPQQKGCETSGLRLRGKSGSHLGAIGLDAGHNACEGTEDNHHRRRPEQHRVRLEGIQDHAGL